MPSAFDQYEHEMFEGKDVKFPGLDDTVISVPWIISLNGFCEEGGVDPLIIECPNISSELMEKKCNNDLLCQN